MSKMVNCKACGKEIATGVNKCVHCGKDQRNFFMKHKVLTVILALVILGGIGSAISEDKPELVKTNEPAVVASTPAVEKPAEATKVEESKEFKVGDTIKLKNLQVKVNKVHIVKGDDFSKPAEGNEFFAVDCTIENISNEEQAISSIMMFKVVDKDGRAQEMSLLGIAASKAGQLDGSIAAGRKMSGAYVVEVPKGTTGLELEFDASLFSSGQIVVKLN